ncbi:hypothetical protein JXA32_02460 [Candidatus Sumerlaeota bacterium]|nr:hypothetical protein [Candidatus Sumerlaeota bacterium]
MNWLQHPVMVLLIGFAASLALTWISIHVANHFDLKAHPDHRSSHTIPTPRIGGIGIASLPLMALAWFGYSYWISPESSTSPDALAAMSTIEIYLLMLQRGPEFIIAAACGGVVFYIVGLWDDLKNLKPIPKFIGQFCGAIIALVWLRDKVYFELAYSRLLFWAIAFCWIVCFVNAFNFMDGMNGKAGVFSAFALSSVLLIIYNIPFRDYLIGHDIREYFDNVLLRELFPQYLKSHFGLCQLLLIGSIGGFLFFNLRPKAKIFMGDCGSHFLGFIIAFEALAFSDSLVVGRLPLLIFITLTLPFTYDVTYTLIKRLREGKNVLQAHREHLYQRLMICGMSHMRVLAICLGTYLLCAVLAFASLLSLSILLRLLYFLGALLCMIIYTFYVFYCESRRPQPSSAAEG